LCLYRITQEALRNIAKHANAKNVDVELWAGADTIRLRIHDNGVGFDQKGVPAGLGLASMRERARLLGGKLTVDSEPGAGTELTVELPVQGEDR
jgi:signal transduction histidine kinase